MQHVCNAGHLGHSKSVLVAQDAPPRSHTAYMILKLEPGREGRALAARTTCMHRDKERETVCRICSNVHVLSRGKERERGERGQESLAVPLCKHCQ